MEFSENFSTGPRLSDAPQGDAARQAVSALKGYAFQLYGSVLAWLELKVDESLFLEVAEDYSVVAHDALKAVQAKETSASVTLNTESVRAAIDAFVDLSHRNPRLTVTLRYFTTSVIGIEHKTADRIDGIAGLEYWRLVAQGADLVPLRQRLLNLKLKQPTLDYIDGLDDETLRERLIRRINWDCGQGRLDDLEAEIEAKLLRSPPSGLRIDPDQVTRVTSALVQQTLITAMAPWPRRLSVAELYRSIKDVTHTLVPTSDLSAFVGALAHVDGQHQLTAIPSPTWLIALEELPLPTRLITRQPLVEIVLGRLRDYGLGILTGSTGLGKTIIARLAAVQVGGNWRLLDLRDLPGVTIADRLTAVLASLSDLNTGGLVLDDLDSWSDDSVRRWFPSLIRALRRRNLGCLVTSHGEPPPSLLVDIGAPSDVLVPVSYLSIPEIAELVVAVGQDARVWAPIVQLMSGGGHPQLVQASIAVLDDKGWPEEEFANLIAGTPEVEQERAIARQRLIEALPDAVRSLLYRLSIIVAHMDRGLALAVAEVAPAIERPGEALERLIGPWVERLAGNQLRVSPLVVNAGVQILGQAEIIAIRHQIVCFLMRGGQINIGDLDTILMHALTGKVEWALAGIGVSITTAKESDLRNIADFSVALPILSTDAPIYPDNSFISWMLRLAQFELLNVNSKPEAFGRCVQAMLRETENRGDDLVHRLARILVLAKVLLQKQTASVIPNSIDLVLEYRELMARSQDIYKGRRGRVPDRSFEAQAIGLMFVVQCLGLQSISALSYVFDRIDELDQTTRDSVFASIDEVPGTPSTMLINSAWLADVRRDTFVWHDAADRFYRMAAQATRWGRRNLALQCHAARAVMADEYGNEPETALAMIGEAESLLGSDMMLGRARAKVLWRKQDHAGALPLLERAIAALPADGVVEKVFLLRDGAISAGETGDWSRAQDWFWQGHVAAASGPPGLMEAMSIGMAADAAVANIHLCCYCDATLQLAGCIERLPDIDPEASVNNAYVHRVVRYATLWALSKMTGEIKTHVTGEPMGMPTGACSNPEPAEAIRSQPLGPLEIAWYLLAKCDLALGGEAGIARSLETRLGDHTIPQCEFSLRFDIVLAAIKACDIASFVDAVISWLDVAAYFITRPAEMNEALLYNPNFSTVPTLTKVQRSDKAPTDAASMAVQALAIYCIMTDRSFPGSELLTGLQGYLEEDHSALKLLLDLEKPALNIDAASPSIAVLSNLVSHAPRSPKELFIASIHLLDFSRVDYRRVLERPVANWIGEEWTKIANTQQFAIASPRINGPAIHAAVARSKGDLASAADIVLTAVPALNLRLGPEIRHRLEQLKNDGESKAAA